MIWEIKCNWGSGGHCEPFVGFIGGPGGKALGKFTIFCAMIVTDKLRKIQKMKTRQRKFFYVYVASLSEKIWGKKKKMLKNKKLRKKKAYFIKVVSLI